MRRSKLTVPPRLSPILSPLLSPLLSPTQPTHAGHAYYQVRAHSHTPNGSQPTPAVPAAASPASPTAPASRLLRVDGVGTAQRLPPVRWLRHRLCRSVRCAAACVARRDADADRPRPARSRCKQCLQRFCMECHDALHAVRDARARRAARPCVTPPRRRAAMLPRQATSGRRCPCASASAPCARSRTRRASAMARGVRGMSSAATASAPCTTPQGRGASMRIARSEPSRGTMYNIHLMAWQELARVRVCAG